jgi:hypothetical protein
MHNYVATEHSLPPAAVLGQDGKPLLSWRVLLLPYIGQQELFHEFKLDEPWDSEHNLTLIERMPRTYAPYARCNAPPHTTFFQVIRGPGTPFERPRMKFEDFNGRMTNMFLIVEAAEPVIWTKPDDLDYHPDGPLPRLGGIMRDGRFRAAMADGSVNSLLVADEDTIRASITGKEP